MFVLRQSTNKLVTKISSTHIVFLKVIQRCICYIFYPNGQRRIVAEISTGGFLT